MLEGFDTPVLTQYTDAITSIRNTVNQMQLDFSAYRQLLPQRNGLLNDRTTVQGSIESKKLALRELNHVEETLNRQYLDRTENPVPQAMNMQDWSILFFFISLGIFCIVTTISFIRMSTQKLQTGMFLGGLSLTICLLCFVLIRSIG